MILSASRRTDIPAYYSSWLFRRLQEGRVAVRNPYNPHQIRQWCFSPETVDCLVFWTKNPLPIMEYLEPIESLGYPYYFQFTLTPYGKGIEPGLPSKDVLTETFCRLGKKLGRNRVVWRYDPILLTDGIDAAWHIAAFERLADKLAPCTDTCVFSFLDSYAAMKKRMRFQPLHQSDMEQIAAGFSRIAAARSIRLASCCEEFDGSAYGISHSACIDKNRIESIIGCPMSLAPDKNQRPLCGCFESVDIGLYDTCPAGCSYCYATKSNALVTRRFQAHDPSSLLLSGQIEDKDIVKECVAVSHKQRQTSFFCD